MLGSFERLRVGNALTRTEETLRSGHRLQLEYILGTFCERISKKCGHAGLSAKIPHNSVLAISNSVGSVTSTCRYDVCRRRPREHDRAVNHAQALDAVHAQPLI